MHAVREVNRGMAEEVCTKGEAAGMALEQLTKRRVTHISASFGEFYFVLQFSEVIGGEDKVVVRARSAYGEVVVGIFNDHGVAYGGGLGDEDVVGICSRGGADKVCGFVAGGAVLDKTPEHERVRFARRLASEAVDVHQAEGESAKISGGQCAAPSGPGDGDKGDAVVGLLEDDNVGQVGDSHAEEFEVASEKQFSVGSGGIPCCVTRARD